MANWKTHALAGVLSPWLIIGLYLLLAQRIPQVFYEINWFFVTLFIVFAGFVGGRLPDWLEPPKHPRHRGILHWLFGFLALVYIVLFLFAFPYLPLLPLTYDALSGLLIVSFLAGYASHFVLDYLISN